MPDVYVNSHNFHQTTQTLYECHYFKKGALKPLHFSLQDPIGVREMMLDFEAATWAALKEAYPTVKLLGCVYQLLPLEAGGVAEDPGSRPSEILRGAWYRLLSKVMALPYLPHEHIPAPGGSHI